MTERAIPFGPAALPGLDGLPRADVAILEGAQPRLVDAALRGPVVLTRHGRDAFVLMPADLCDRLMREAAQRQPKAPPVIEG